ncbi:MAG: sigma-54-dependent Fis family transcriptional regulator, partial [Alphaproteobacteria bacterium]|nr:sigma-54-dependent Fis family transcriptional regulator [Alphaproteobacteria bacterium]
LHAGSPRKSGPFIAINCAALPAPLLESELFGHVKGAFTAAHRTHEGLIAAAAGGTLFLDEIADMPAPLQAKLLRFIENGTFRKVGSTEEERADVRVIAATHGDLKSAAAAGAFRVDLYYRLSVLTLEMPPLRARKEDIPQLAEHFLRRYSVAEGKDFAEIAPEAAARLSAYPWPGNIRELQNALHKIVVLHAGVTLTAAMAESVLPQNARVVGENIITLGAASEASVRPLWQVQKDAIETAIRLCGGNIPRAAALLRVSPSTLYRRRGVGSTDSEDISIS